MTKIINAVLLALVAAVAGCGTLKQATTPAPALDKVQAVKPTPLPPTPQKALPPAVQPVLSPATPSVVPVAVVPFTTHPWKWEHPGAAPFAKTRAEAMQQREKAIRKLGFPERCVAPLVAAMGKPSEKVTMKMGDRFAAQISKGDVIHGLKEGGGVVAFKTPMLPGMQLVAQAEKWTVVCEGQVQTVFMPAVCFNITAGIPVTVPVAPALTPPAKQLVSTPVVADECYPPYGKYLFTVHGWEPLLPGSLHDEAYKLIGAAKKRNSENATRVEAYKPDDFSRTMGGRLRAGDGQHTSATWAVVVLLRNPKTLVIEENLGILYLVGGVGSVELSETQHLKLVEVTMWPAKFDSPVSSGGEQRLWTLPQEWKNYRCMNVHGLEKP